MTIFYLRLCFARAIVRFFDRIMQERGIYSIVVGAFVYAPGIGFGYVHETNGLGNFIEHKVWLRAVSRNRFTSRALISIST